MGSQRQRLQRKIAELEYRVESYGSYGDERELAALRRELACIEEACADAGKRTYSQLRLVS